MASREKPERLSREDAARWHMGTPENPMVIGALLLFDERLSLGALEELVRSKLVPHRRFHQHVVEPAHRFARPSWRDDAPFKLDEHVRNASPSGGVDDAALVRLASERMSAPLPPHRSPWMLELLDRAGGGSALIARIHHCIADGRALVALLGELAGRLAEPRAPAPTRATGAERRRGFWARLIDLFRTLPLFADPVGVLRGRPTGRKRVAWSAPIPLESVKAVARATGHHVADVLLAGVAGALERHARAHGRTLRPLRTLLPVAAPPASSHDELGNHYASVFVRLPVDVTDPRARLELIGRDMAAVRRGGELRLAMALMRLVGAAAPALERWAIRWWARRASLIVSSLAGPPAPIQLAGRHVRSVVVWAPAAASIGLSITLFGYAGALHLGLLADDAVLDRPDDFVAAFDAALDDLRRGASPNTP